MKRIFGLSLLVLCFSSVLIQAQEVSLPKECQKILNKKFNGWQLTKVGITEGVQGRNLIKGDWNGDGKTDYAVLIDYGKNVLGNGSLEPAVWAVVLIAQKRGYLLHKFEGGDSIALMKKGERDYNYQTGKNFKYKNDAIFVGIGMAGASYIWRKGKFIEIVTSD